MPATGGQPRCSAGGDGTPKITARQDPLGLKPPQLPPPSTRLQEVHLLEELALVVLELPHGLCLFVLGV